MFFLLKTFNFNLHFMTETACKHSLLYITRKKLITVKQESILQSFQTILLKFFNQADAAIIILCLQQTAESQGTFW